MKGLKNYEQLHRNTAFSFFLYQHSCHRNFFYFLSIGIIALSVPTSNHTSLDICREVWRDQCKSHDIPKLSILVTVF